MGGWSIFAACQIGDWSILEIDDFLTFVNKLTCPAKINKNRGIFRRSSIPLCEFFFQINSILEKKSEKSCVPLWKFIFLSIPIWNFFYKNILQIFKIIFWMSLFTIPWKKTRIVFYNVNIGAQIFFVKVTKETLFLCVIQNLFQKF